MKYDIGDGTTVTFGCDSGFVSIAHSYLSAYNSIAWFTGGFPLTEGGRYGKIVTESDRYDLYLPNRRLVYESESTQSDPPWGLANDACASSAALATGTSGESVYGEVYQLCNIGTGYYPEDPYCYLSQ